MVSLLLNEEQEQISNSVCDFLRSELPIDRLIAPGNPGAATDHAKWSAMAEMGWFGLGLPEKAGGVGYSAIEEAILFKELGRHLVTPSVMASNLGARLALAAGDKEIADAIMSGTMRPSLALPVGPAEIGPRISGRFQIVDGENAPLVLFVSPEASALVERRTLNALKASRSGDDPLSLEVGQFDGAAALIHAGAAAKIHRHGVLLSAALLSGICEQTCRMASEYAKVRETFGNPIGKYQAVKHKCAEMAIRADAVNALVSFSSITVRDDRGDADFQAAAAKLLATQYALLNAKENIQVHGAVGFTAEMPAHLFLKRSHMLDRFCGAIRQQQLALLSEPTSKLKAG